MIKKEGGVALSILSSLLPNAYYDVGNSNCDSCGATKQKMVKNFNWLFV